MKLWEKKEKGKENDRGKKINEGRGGREKSKHFLRVQTDIFW